MFHEAIQKTKVAHFFTDHGVYVQNS